MADSWSFIKIDPLFAPLRGEPRFNSMLKMQQPE
jgi:hypothetical protein